MSDAVLYVTLAICWWPRMSSGEVGSSIQVILQSASSFIQSMASCTSQRWLASTSWIKHSTKITMIMITIIIMKNFKRCSSYHHHGWKRRELVQHAHPRGRLCTLDNWFLMPSQLRRSYHGDRIARIHLHTYINTVTTTKLFMIIIQSHLTRPTSNYLMLRVDDEVKEQIVTRSHKRGLKSINICITFAILTLSESTQNAV